MKRCHCGAFVLPSFAPWVTLPSVAHTETRCGEVSSLEVAIPAFGEAPRLLVTWVAK